MFRLALSWRICVAFTLCSLTTPTAAENPIARPLNKENDNILAISRPFDEEHENGGDFLPADYVANGFVFDHEGNFANVVQTTTRPPSWVLQCQVIGVDGGQGATVAKVECGGHDVKVIPFLPFAVRKDLVYYRMTGTLIKKITRSTFKQATRLKYVSLDDNRLSRLDADAFLDSQSLEFLSMRNNNLKNILPGTFNSLTNLWFLDLSMNFIRALDTAPFLGMHSVRYLNLADNPIATIECGFFSNFLPAMNNLNMTRSQIECKVAPDAQNNEKDFVSGEIQCNCGSGYTRKSYCHNTDCPASIRKIVNVRLAGEAINLGAGSDFVSDSIYTWKQDLHDTLLRARLGPHNRAAGTSGNDSSGKGKESTTLMIVVMSVGLLALSMGVAMVARWRKENHTSVTDSTLSSTLKTSSTGWTVGATSSYKGALKVNKHSTSISTTSTITPSIELDKKNIV